MESEAFEDMQKGGGSLRMVKDLGAGAAGGIAQVLLGMFCSVYILNSRRSIECTANIA